MQTQNIDDAHHLVIQDMIVGTSKQIYQRAFNCDKQPLNIITH